jgi:hypothetical protein
MANTHILIHRVWELGMSHAYSIFFPEQGCELEDIQRIVDVNGERWPEVCVAYVDVVYVIRGMSKFVIHSSCLQSVIVQAGADAKPNRYVFHLNVE